MWEKGSKGADYSLLFENNAMAVLWLQSQAVLIWALLTLDPTSEHQHQAKYYCQHNTRAVTSQTRLLYSGLQVDYSVYLLKFDFYSTHKI